MHRLIQDAGLARYYDLRTAPTAPPPELRPDPAAWLDRLLAEVKPEPLRSLTLDVQGIHCAACVWLLREVYRRLDGAVDLRINPGAGRAKLYWRGDADTARQFVREARRYGYRLGPPGERATSTSRGLLIRLAVSSAVAMNAMIFSLSFYFGLAPSDGILFHFFGWLNLGLGTVAAVVGGGVFVSSAVRAARRGMVHLDLPIATGIVLAWGGSVWGALSQGPRGGYFDSLAVFVTLMLLGRFLQERHLERNAAALLATDGLDSLSTRVRRDGRVTAVPAADVVPGDELWIVPGDLVPVRAVLREEPTLASLDWINGESRPRSFAVDDELPAGSFNATDRVVRARAAEGFASSRLHELLRPADTGGERASDLWGRVARVYVTAVFGLAAAGFLLWMGHGLARALEVTVSILVVTCPCAIGIAVPMAHELAHHRLRRQGVFVRRSGFLDRALRVRHLLFDKTGTLTRGRPSLRPEAIETLRALSPDDRALLHDLTVRSNHPVSRAVAAAIRDLDGERATRTDLGTREVIGSGIEAVVAGEVHRIGRPAFADCTDAAREAPAEDAVCWSVDGSVRARFPYGEELRPDAATEVRALAAGGWHVHLLSGDAPDRVAEAARALDVDPALVHAECSSEEKARIVRELDRGDTLMVGDGLNDAPAFSQATCAGTPAIDHAALPARADFYYLGDGIVAVRAALETAIRLRRVVRDDLLLAALYNAGALSLCFAGVVTPPVAAVLMPLGSLGILAVTAARLSGRRRTEDSPWK